MIDIVTDIGEMRRISDRKRADGLKIGLVPTMGALHEGHLSLIRRAVECSDFLVVSIFVNPAQFGPNEDFTNYPRNLGGDARLVEAAGAQLIFAPGSSGMYPDGYATFVTVERLTGTLCGFSRPNHFRGVTTVITKLFTIVNPHIAMFGQKDAQQLAVIKRMVRDLDMPVEIIPCPTVREPDGLAMSSRNNYLSGEERKQAPILYQSLLAAQELVNTGVTGALEIIRKVRGVLAGSPLLDIEYVEMVDPDEMTAVHDATGGALLAMAGRFGKTRLIDNIVLIEKKG